MKVLATLAAFAVGLVAVFALSFAVGRQVGPVDDDPAPAVTATTVDHGGDHDMDMGGNP